MTNLSRSLIDLFCWGVLQCVVVCCSVLQCVAVCCVACCIVLQCATVCSLDRCMNVCVQVYVCIGACVCESVNVYGWMRNYECLRVYAALPVATQHCNTLQHTATHCNTPCMGECVFANVCAYMLHCLSRSRDLLGLQFALVYMRVQVCKFACVHLEEYIRE